MKRLLWLIAGLNRRMMKLLFALALIAYIACKCTHLSIQEQGKMKIEQRIDEVRLCVLSHSFSQKYPPVKFLSEKDRKRILITGGAGFVGSHLTDKLMMDGHEVTVVDNFFTGRKRNVEHWIGHENFELINHDVVEPLYIEVDQIYHLASPASPPNYMYNPIKTLKTNTIGTLNMLGLAKRVGARLLLASTSEVYGDPEVHPQNEEYWGHVNPIGPRACYDEGKRVAETMCYAYMKQEGVEVRVARIFNTFGSRMHMNDGRVVSNFILQALQGEPLTFQLRNFSFVQIQTTALCELFSSDLVNGLVLLMNSNISSPVNLGNPEEHTILEFARLIKSLVVSRSQIQFLPEAQDDPQRRRPDIRKAKMMLGWEPVVPLEEGLNKTIQYFSRELEHQANNQYIPKPKAARMKKGRPRHN
uniref:UDP-glucuronic acid decarboxylase 1 n=1 Tax=Amphiprion ocellaris TaxID=80972 RepID=A0AAQ5XUA6_AMPOC